MSGKRKYGGGMSRQSSYKRGRREPVANMQRRPRKNVFKRSHNKSYVAVKNATAQMLRNVGNSYMPMIYSTRLVYDSTLPFNCLVPALGAIDQAFRGNSIYDPVAAAGGTTVNGHAELGAIYGRYRVTGSRITVTCVGKTLANEMAKLYVWADKDSTLVTNPMIAAHVPNAVSANLDENYDQKKLVAYANSGTMYSIKSADDVAMGATWSANPANQWYWHMCVCGNDQDVVKCHVVIEYYTICSDLIKTYPSTY